uniref:Uncharacterized protein n=1 Tax=Glossina austeni TaxID=7395 RepID=A0A1A9VA31_GLOAU
MVSLFGLIELYLGYEVQDNADVQEVKISTQSRTSTKEKRSKLSVALEKRIKSRKSHQLVRDVGSPALLVDHNDGGKEQEDNKNHLVSVVIRVPGGEIQIDFNKAIGNPWKIRLTPVSH